MHWLRRVYCLPIIYNVGEARIIEKLTVGLMIRNVWLSFLYFIEWLFVDYCWLLSLFKCSSLSYRRDWHSFLSFPHHNTPFIWQLCTSYVHYIVINYSWLLCISYYVCTNYDNLYIEMAFAGDLYIPPSSSAIVNGSLSLRSFHHNQNDMIKIIYFHSAEDEIATNNWLFGWQRWTRLW